MSLSGEGITVFCSSSDAAAPKFRSTAFELGQSIAEQGLVLVYGGMSVGLMGIVANASLSNGGKVVGVIPRQFADLGFAHSGLTELITVKTMHDRKRIMFERASAFVALPGGVGTFDELLEQIAWKSIGLHNNPIVLLNIDNYFQGILSQLDRAIDERLSEAKHKRLLAVVSNVDDCLKCIETRGDD